jgi:hypothetical protein
VLPGEQGSGKKVENFGIYSSTSDKKKYQYAPEAEIKQLGGLVSVISGRGAWLR